MKISVIKHQYLPFVYKQGNAFESEYLLYYLLKQLLQDKQIENFALLTLGNAPETDLAIMHVDASRVDQAYQALAKPFKFCVNQSVTDITKKVSSDLTVTANDNYEGPFIVKSNLNYYGMPEILANKHFKQSGTSGNMPSPDARFFKDYSIIDSLDKLRINVFDDPNLTLERFLPEKEGQHYVIRHYFFCGETEFCNKYYSEETIVKGSNFIKKVPCEVPELVRQKRKDMGLHYGKFDFVMHDGQPFIFDTNKTPGSPPLELPETQNMIKALSQGLLNLLEEHA